MTGLKSFYDLDLQWTPENATETSPDSIEEHPSLFGAVEQQLGLKLEVRKGPVEILVIDHADRVPREN